MVGHAEFEAARRRATLRRAIRATVGAAADTNGAKLRDLNEAQLQAVLASLLTDTPLRIWVMDFPLPSGSTQSYTVLAVTEEDALRAIIASLPPIVMVPV